MTKKYIVVASEDIKAATQDKVTHYFQQNGMDIWHWITNVWLVIDKGDKHRNQIRDDLKNIVNVGPLLIFEVNDPALCTGFAAPIQSKWILENWVNVEPKF